MHLNFMLALLIARYLAPVAHKDGQLTQCGKGLNWCHNKTALRSLLHTTCARLDLFQYFKLHLNFDQIFH